MEFFMSEYQYYEFQAVDRLLTEQEKSELRSCSSRAVITPHSFTNEYAWGSFKGHENRWMDKYFDGFLYYSYFGTHTLKLRLPALVLDLSTAQTYSNGDNFSARLCNDKIILDFSSTDEGGSDYEEELRLSQFLSLRSDLSRGDVRCLYLGWLAGLQSDDYDEEALEPPVPPGLNQLNSALVDLADFLRIDHNLMEAASRRSLVLEQTTPNSQDIRVWLNAFSDKEKETLLVDLLESSIKGDPFASLQLVHRFNKNWHSPQADTSQSRRTIAELLIEAKEISLSNLRKKAEKAAAEKVEQERLNSLAREKKLNDLKGKESLLWNQIESFICEKKATSYDKAMALLMDLRDLAARSNLQEFLLKVNALKQRHSSKPSLIERLRNFNLLR
jgi:hypothetical protein